MEPCAVEKTKTISILWMRWLDLERSKVTVLKNRRVGQDGNIHVCLHEDTETVGACSLTICDMVSGELVRERDPWLWPPSLKALHSHTRSTLVDITPEYVQLLHLSHLCSSLSTTHLGVMLTDILSLSVLPRPSLSKAVHHPQIHSVHLLPPAPMLSPASNQGFEDLSLDGYTECLLRNQINSSGTVNPGHVSQVFSSPLLDSILPLAPCSRLSER